MNKNCDAIARVEGIDVDTLFKPLESLNNSNVHGKQNIAKRRNIAGQIQYVSLDLKTVIENKWIEMYASLKKHSR